MSEWNQIEAIALATLVESVCVPAGCHVALTGGLLYKQGPRKDCDLLFYRIRQAPEVKMDQLWAALSGIGITKLSGSGWCYKAQWNGKPIDCFFPEEHGGDYNQQTP